jgi:hypothetical protein
MIGAVVAQVGDGGETVGMGQQAVAQVDAAMGALSSALSDLEAAQVIVAGIANG